MAHLYPLGVGVKHSSGSCVLEHLNGFVFLIGWCILFVLCWPLALLALVLAPLIWLLLLPLRLLGICTHATFALIWLLLLPLRLLGTCTHATFALIWAVLLLPARLLGYRPAR